MYEPQIYLYSVRTLTAIFSEEAAWINRALLRSKLWSFLFQANLVQHSREVEGLLSVLSRSWRICTWSKRQINSVRILTTSWWIKTFLELSQSRHRVAISTSQVTQRSFLFAFRKRHDQRNRVSVHVQSLSSRWGEKARKAAKSSGLLLVPRKNRYEMERNRAHAGPPHQSWTVTFGKETSCLGCRVVKRNLCETTRRKHLAPGKKSPSWHLSFRFFNFVRCKKRKSRMTKQDD